MFRRKFLGMVLLAGLLISQSVPRALAATYCDQAQFVSDMTVPDGSSFAPGATFTKTWRLMNVGTCAWNTSYMLVWAGGDPMTAPSVKLPVEVPPGQMLDLSVSLTAPSTAGHYKALFKISNASGVQFGIGDSASDPFWADINVVETSAVIYDFVANAPYAQWRSGAGIIPFPGTSGDSRGYSYQVNNPHLEDDSLDPAPGLLVVPQNKFNGYIQATYPEFQIQQGDRLQTLVNCEFGATNCYVTFRIDYLLPNGAQRTLWTWKEAYDKRFYRANIDLSPLAGQNVRFVFMVLSSGFASGDRAIWGSPRITRTGPAQPPGPPPTLTPLPPLPPTATPIGQPPPTVVPSGCDKAAFVTDATVPDGTIFSPGAAFTKTWRLRNVGSCAWTTSYKLVYYSGDPLGAPTAVNLPWNVAFNQTVDISVNMVAPSMAGKYRGFWILANTNGQFFGIGSDASNPIWVEINVAGEAPVNTGYDFTTNVCSAEWRSTVGVLPCPGTDGNTNGFVLKLDAPKLEDGTTGTVSLLTVPQNRYNGYIQGFYPTFTVQPGDKFQTTVGCAFGAACYLTYRLDYMTASGYIGTFWTWREQNEGRVYNANLDLTPLAGRSVRFILTILATGTAANDRAIWGSPRIVRAGGATPPTPTPTATQTPPPVDWLKYTNPTYGFEFKYPPQAQIVDQSNNSLKMNLPFTPGTNLREKYLQVSVVENANPCQSPLSSISPPGSPTETVVFNGISFLKQVGGDAGVGHLRQWVGYSTLKNNACISMDFVLHSLAPDNSSTPPPVFDKAAESAVFAQMMGTFVWTPATVTPIPPTVPPVLVQSPDIRRLFMIDTSNGWAIGNSYVLHTYDGGASWYSLTPQGISTIRNAFFTSPNHGWVLTTDSVYRTRDGGTTWSQYTVPFNGGYVQFLDDVNGFVLSGVPSGMHKHAVSLYQTSDGGETWTLKYANDPSQPNNTLPFGGIKNGMAFRDTATGWVGGYIPSPGAVYLYKTTNGGVTWAQQSLALPAEYASADVVDVTSPTFFGLNDGILPVWASNSAGGALLTYVTHDGGANWVLSGNVPSQGRKAYDFISRNDGVAWNGTLQVTHNAGASWNSVTLNVNFGDNVLAMDFISPTIGWILQNSNNGSTPLYRTTDGGATWTLISGTAPPTEPPGPLPDLTIVQIHIELQNPSCFTPGDTMGVRLWIKNNGQAAADSFVVMVNNLEQTVSGLGVGETKDVFFAGYSNPVNAVVDPMNLIAESDESNNSRSEMVPVPTPPLPCVNPTELAQTIVQALNAKSFGAVRSKMGESFTMAIWQSQGSSITPDEAVLQLENNYIGAATVLTHDPDRDLNALLGTSPYTIMGLDPSNSLAFFVSGWGWDGKGEAILYTTKRTGGNSYWHGVLIAPTGFATGSVSHEAFCADTRIPALIEQLKASMNQSNGDMFASLISPAHGVDVRFWAYAAHVNFSTEKGRNVFSSAESYNWGGGPRGIPDVGSFRDIIQPKLLEVLNAPNMETYCDDLTKVFPLSHPWPYPNVRYYNLYKPATATPGNEFDFRTWLIGFEYINDQPYLHSMVTIVWEP
jgi:photosystem II stability/assembly factor-like uncharacterized protein